MNHRPKRRECAMNTQVYKTQIKYKKNTTMVLALHTELVELKWTPVVIWTSVAESAVSKRTHTHTHTLLFVVFVVVVVVILLVIFFQFSLLYTNKIMLIIKFDHHPRINRLFALWFSFQKLIVYHDFSRK